MKIKNALIGFSGFVGSNLSAQFEFEKKYNSKNIGDIDGAEIDLVVCAGVSAIKWLANQEPKQDSDGIENLKKHLLSAKINRFVLLSTIDIYDFPCGVNENMMPVAEKQDHYGRHRYQLERWVIEKLPVKHHHIIRLPALFGKNIKKNFIFDIVNPLAKSINKILWEEIQKKLSADCVEIIEKNYLKDFFGNLQLQSDVTLNEKNQLTKIFDSIHFSSLNFTDSRSCFQFYDLNNLWKDIGYAIEQNHSILNMSCEPITASELIHYVRGIDFTNHTSKGAVRYDMHSQYAKDKRYFYLKDTLLEKIKEFIEESE